LRKFPSCVVLIRHKFVRVHHLILSLFICNSVLISG
jgi:hypothetical protein